MLRTHTCGELCIEHCGQQVTLAGWVHRRRDHGPVLFIDLRDRYGITQVIADSTASAQARAALEPVRNEYVLQVCGRVRRRPPGADNPHLATGAIDEDLRADRQPEFTQLDLEMSFAEQDDILAVVESLMTVLVPAAAPHSRLISPFPRLTYAEPMTRFGTDKPDLRYGLELMDISDLVTGSEFGVFAGALATGAQVKGLRAPGCAGYSRRQTDELREILRTGHARGGVFIAVEEHGQRRTSLAKFFTAA
jgi:aspartyl-tRNA synthetase